MDDPGEKIKRTISYSAWARALNTCAPLLSEVCLAPPTDNNVELLVISLTIYIFGFIPINAYRVQFVLQMFDILFEYAQTIVNYVFLISFLTFLGT